MANNKDIQNIDSSLTSAIQSLASKIESLIANARQQVARVVNTAEVVTKYEIGRAIVEEMQDGAERAAYGKRVLQGVSNILTESLGDGWSVETLTLCRKFYTTYCSKIVNSVYEIAKTNSVNTVGQIPQFSLSWSHYLVLMRIDNTDERHFYEIESQKENWSVRQLQRQYASSLYERLALSKEKTEVMRLANEGQVVEKPQDILKNPVTLEFLGLKSASIYSETKLESAIIGKLQQFLLEMGKGFLFEARQKRFSFNEKNFYVDLVLYNRLLQCYVLIDLKIDELTHQDLGQMQMYVNYYDRYQRQEREKPTIGILLCKSKDDALVELTLPKDSNVYAQEYALYLPDKAVLQKKLAEWIEEENII